MWSTPRAPAPGRFLHVVPDDKFITAAAGIFEQVAPGAHDYAHLGDADVLSHLRLPLRKGGDLPALIADTPRYSAVFLHFLDAASRRFVAMAPATTRMVWLGWGADYYHLIAGDEDALLMPRTRQVMAERSPPTAGDRLKALARSAASPLTAARRVRRASALRRLGVLPGGTGEMALLSRIEAMATPVRADHDAIRRRHPGFPVGFIDWTYWTEGFQPTQCAVQPSGRDILLGNSATPTNNHFDGLALIAAAPDDGRKVICPLSYGDRAYADEVERAGRAMLGDRFVSVREFLPPARYAALVASCSVVLMLQLRQQAMGNILMALAGGARVFMDARNPVVSTLSALGLGIDDAATLPAQLADGLSLPELDVVVARQRRLDEQYGREAIVEKTKAMLSRFG